MFIEKLNNIEDSRELRTFISEMDTLISSDIRDSRLFVFLGAGFSSMFKLPNWESLIEQIMLDVMYHNDILGTEYEKDIQFYLLKLKYSNINIKLKISLINQLLISKLKSNEILYNSLCRNMKLKKSVLEYSSVTEKEIKLLNDLGKINAVFCTTNFDNVLKEVLNIENQIVKSPEYVDYGRNGIIHLHGALEKSNKHDFMEDLTFDFESYLKRYNSPGKSISLLKEIVDIDKLKNSTILFLGSSMQEPELVGLISGDECFTNKYALLGFDSKEDYEISSSFYSKKYNINIIGYNSSRNHNLFNEIITKISLGLAVKSPGSALDKFRSVLKDEVGE